jgi:hypothetical protein
MAGHGELGVHVGSDQREFDRALRAGQPSDCITIDAPAGTTLYVPRIVYPMPQRFRLSGQSVVEAAGGGRWMCGGASRLTGRDLQHVRLSGGASASVVDSTVEAFGQAKVRGVRIALQQRDEVESEILDPLDTVPNLASRVEALGGRCVLHGPGLLVIGGDATADVYDTARVELAATGAAFLDRLTLHDRAVGTLRSSTPTGDRFVAELWDKSRAELLVPRADAVTVRAHDQSEVAVLMGRGLQLELTDDAKAWIGNGVRCQARGRSHVVAAGSAKVELFDQAEVDRQGWDVIVIDHRTASTAVAGRA